MAVESTLVYEQDPPKRPALSDVLNGDKVNYPPSASVDPDIPDAAEFNQSAKLHNAHGKMVPLARIAVTFSGGTPSVASCITVRSDVVAGDITLTDNGNGDTTITLPTDKFPSQNSPPRAWLNDTTHGFITTSVATNGARVRTANTSGSATDKPFTVEIF